MPTTTLTSAMPASAAQLFAWHAAPGALDRLLPPWSGVRVERRGEVCENATVTLSIPAGPLRLRWVARHHDVVPPTGFADTQESGPFAAWTHHHRFADGALTDTVDWRLGMLASPAARAITNELVSVLRWRHQRTRRDLERHQARAEQPRLTIAVSGAGGLVGGELLPFLSTGGHQVRPLVRGSAPGGIPWDPQRGLLDADELAACDAVVHLAGAPVATRWTATAMAEIRSSRVVGTRLLAQRLAESVRRGGRTTTLIIASGINGYAPSDQPQDESSPLAGTGFLADVVRAWEDAAAPAREAGIRVVHLRTGMVLSPKGGALAKLLPPARLGLGGPVGSGDQWVSWIDLDDLVGLIHHLIVDGRVEGPVNAVAPGVVRQREFARQLGTVLHRPAFAPLPERVVTTAFGSMGRSLLLDSLRIVPRVAGERGFIFRSPDLLTALRFELGRG